VTFIKVCGITRGVDAQEAARRGASAVGFVFWPQSSRYVDPARASEIIAELPASVRTVGVFVNQPTPEIARIAAETRISMIQLHGDEPPSATQDFAVPVMKAMTLAEAATVLDAWPQNVLVLLDAHDPVRRGGTGSRIDWLQAASIAARRPVVLAVGLTPENVEEALETVRPFGVDVSSGVEQAPGIKSMDKMARFLERAQAVHRG
jgi:phosphoribosylanthranilate isomerase